MQSELSSNRNRPYSAMKNLWFHRIVSKRDKLDKLDEMLEQHGGILQANPRLNKMIISPVLLKGYVLICRH